MELPEREKLTAVALFVVTSLALPVIFGMGPQQSNPGDNAYVLRSALLELKLDAALRHYSPEPDVETQAVFDREYWLTFAATMEDNEQRSFLQQLAVACVAFGREEDARFIQTKSKLQVKPEDPFSYVLDGEKASAERIEKDGQATPLPASITQLILRKASADSGEGTAGAAQLLTEQIEPFAAGLAVVVTVFALFFVTGLVLLGLAPRIIRRFPVPVWAYGVNRFKTSPVQTYAIFLGWFAMATLLGMAGVMVLGQELSRSGVIFTVYVATALAGFWLVKTKAMTDMDRPLVTVDLNRIQLRTVLFGVGGYVVAVPVVAALAWVSAALLGGGSEGINPAVPLLVGAETTTDRWLIIISVVVMAPLFEEFFFRGFLFQQFRGLVGVAHGIALAALVFAAVHQSIEMFLPLFGLGVILALVYHYSQSLWASVITHSLWNLATVIAILFLYGD